MLYACFQVLGGIGWMNPNSAKGRLKNIATQSNRTFQDVLVSYAAERLLYRISISRFKGNLVLKGGMLLYAMFDTAFPRSTSDIDFLGIEIGNASEQILAIFREVFAINYDDAIIFDQSSIEIMPINEFKVIHGVKVTGMAYLDRTKIPVSIDIGFGDVIYPDALNIRFPTLLDMDPANITSYSKETIIAEKLHAIVSLGSANSRFKDFYDIYLLQRNFDFDSGVLSTALIETFKNRATEFSTIIAFETSFVEDILRNQQWDGFMKKRVASRKIDFRIVIDEIQQFLLPIVNTILSSQPLNKSWDHERKMWLHTQWKIRL
jgi:predicted nucleotidyltransferase component of viral defense system